MNDDLWNLRIAGAFLLGIPLIVAAALRLLNLIENVWNYFQYHSLGVRRLSYEEIENNHDENGNIVHNNAPLDQLNIDILDLEEKMDLDSSIIAPSTPFA